MRIRILVILCIATAAASMGMGIVIPIFPQYLENLGISGMMLGVVFAAFFPSFALSSPIVGKLSDRIGYKPIIALGLGVHVPVALLFIIAGSVFQLILIRLVVGVLVVMVLAAAMAYTGAIAPKNQEGLYMGIFNTFLLMGNGLGPLIGGYLMDLYNINMPFYVMAGCLLVAFIFVLFFVPNKKLAPEEDTNYNPEKEMPIQNALKSNLLKGMILFGFIIALSQNGLMIILPIRAQVEHFTTTQIGILSSTIFISAGVMLPLFGYLAGKYNKLFFLIAGVLIVGVIMAIVPIISGFPTFFFLAVMVGIGLATGLPAANAIIIKELKKFNIGLGYGFGLYNLAMGLGLIIGPIFCGFILDKFGLNQALSFISTLLLLSSLLIFYIAKDINNI